MTSTLGCIGLAVDGDEELEDLLARVLPQTVPIGSAAGVDVLRWQDPSGARIVLGVAGSALTWFSPSYAGTPGARLENVVAVNDDVVTASVVDEDGEVVAWLAAGLEQRLLLSPGVPASGSAAVVSLGVDVTAFPDADAYAASDASLVDPDSEPGDPAPRYVENGWGWPPRYAAESFLSYAVFAEGPQANAYGRLAGTVLHTDTRQAAATGQRFHVARVRTADFHTDVCLAAAEHEHAPSPGEVLAGTVYLVVSMDVSGTDVSGTDVSGTQASSEPVRQRRWPLRR